VQAIDTGANSDDPARRAWTRRSMRTRVIGLIAVGFFLLMRNRSVLEANSTDRKREDALCDPVVHVERRQPYGSASYLGANSLLHSETTGTRTRRWLCVADNRSSDPATQRYYGTGHYAIVHTVCAEVWLQTTRSRDVVVLVVDRSRIAARSRVA
jgi:hypothetical protein